MNFYIENIVPECFCVPDSRLCPKDKDHLGIAESENVLFISAFFDA